jgi:NitT/TauT family transport system permease protein
MMLRRLLQALVAPLILIGFFAVWEFYVRAFVVSRFILPPPTRIVTALIDLLHQPTIWRHTAITIEETLGGFLVATVIGVGLGALLGKVPWLERALNPLIVASQVVPKVALVPLFILWFGFGITSKVVIAAVLASFPILTNTVLGVKSVERGHHAVMDSLRVGGWQRFWELELPSALPYILTGMEVGIVLSTIGAVVGEYLGGSDGLGAMAVTTLNALQVDTLFAVILLLTLIGLTLYLAIAGLRRLIVPWHDSVRSRTSGPGA